MQLVVTIVVHAAEQVVRMVVYLSHDCLHNEVIYNGWVYKWSLNVDWIADMLAASSSTVTLLVSTLNISLSLSYSFLLSLVLCDHHVSFRTPGK